MKPIKWDLSRILERAREAAERRLPELPCLPVGGQVRVTCGATDLLFHVGEQGYLVFSKNPWRRGPARSFAQLYMMKKAAGAL